MAYDEVLAARIRTLLAAEPDITEKRMFGSQAFLYQGHLVICASGQGGIMVRVDPEDTVKLLASTPAEIMVMQNRPLKGWLRVNADDAQGAALAVWVRRGLVYAKTLPPKT
ncbi:TfoX/Sxy family protein [Candidatus Saccharibacteria bacterium]|nr:TfoX/Sxy family protein [Candidatus Saccharibacteria bacterium]